MHFSEFGFLPRISENIVKMGYQTPTPIQEQAIGPVMEGRDVMGLAQTGTGKTAAFMLPILNRMLSRPAPKRRHVRTLVVAPTRELAEQIAEATLAMSRGTGIRVATVYGGVGQMPQVRAFQRGVDIIVACPGRLLDHMNQGNADLSKVETLVLDEADHMFDMGFLPDIRRILKGLPTSRQTLLFSATMPSDIRHLAHDVLTDPITVRIGHQAPAETVDQALHPVVESRKTPLLLELIGSAKGSVLVFTRTKHRAKKIALQVERAGHKATSLQGNLSQRKRQIALDGFRDGTFRVLVATDIAARGIDVTRVGCVINYDIPNTPEAYTHRIGRTGRAERSGEAHSFVTREDTGMVRAIERLLGKPLPRKAVAGFDYMGGAQDGQASPAKEYSGAGPNGRSAGASRNRQGRKPGPQARPAGTSAAGSSRRDDSDDRRASHGNGRADGNRKPSNQGAAAGPRRSGKGRGRGGKGLAASSR